MTVRERTRQQLDPAGSIGTGVVTSVIAAGVVVFSVVMTLMGVAEISSPPLAGLALAAEAAAAATLAVASGPRRAPFGREPFILAVSLGCIAIALSAASTWSSDAGIRDDWAAVAVGVILIACGPYRPVRELLIGGSLSALLVGFVTLLQYRWYVTEAPAAAFIIVAVTPLLAMCFAGAVYSGSVVRSIERWQRRASAANLSLMREVHGGIARSVQQDRVTILNRDVLPYLREVLATGEVDEETRMRARQISDSIRSVMVSEADRSWLETVLDEVAGPGNGQRMTVDDPEHLASGMAPDQRIALRAFLVALLTSPRQSSPRLLITVGSGAGLCEVRLIATLGASEHLHRLTLAPYLAVMRAVFSHLELDFSRSALTLEFSYEQH